MARSVPAVTAFNSGELSPTLQARVDLSRYASGCRTLLNMLVLAEGPATRRPGTRFVARTKNDGVVRLIPFEFSTVQAYVIEVGAGYFRFYRDGGVIESSPGVPYEVANPYSAGDLPALRWVQSADVLYLAHPAHAPRKLSRTGHTAWTLSTIAFQDGPYLEERTDLTVTPSATTGSVTLTASASLWVASDVGRLVRLKHGTAWGWATITAFTSATVVTATVGTAFGATTASVAFRLGTWTAGNYPGVVAFFEERLMWAGAPQQPQAVWGSRTGLFEDMAPGAAADDALQFSILDGQVNAIRWLSPQKALLAGTASAEFALAGDNGALSPTSAQARRQTTTGSAAVSALAVGFAAMHVGRSARTLWEIGFSFDRDGYISTEISALSRHVLRPGIAEVVWQQDPWRAVWCVLADGTMAGLTYMRDQEVVAWHRHELGGPGAKVLSAAVIPAGAEGQLWLTVERDYAGTPRRFVEVMAEEFAPPLGTNDAIEAFFVDCGLTYRGTATATIGGLGHLAGQTVSVLADGATHPDVVVSGGGTITLQRAAEVVHVGFGYVSDVEPLDIQGGAPDGVGLTRMKRVAWLGLMLFRTVGGLAGWRDPRTGSVAFEPIEMRLGSDPMDTGLPLATGTVQLQFPARWGRDASVVIRQDQPLPMTVLGIVPRMQTND